MKLICLVCNNKLSGFKLTDDSWAVANCRYCMKEAKAANHTYGKKSSKKEMQEQKIAEITHMKEDNDANE